MTTLAGVFADDGADAGVLTAPQQQERERQRARVRALSQGPFGRLVLRPRPFPHGAPPGWTVLTYEGDESRGGAKGRLHRSLVKFEKGGVRVILESSMCSPIDGHVLPRSRWFRK